jgi:hypothetical protein
MMTKCCDSRASRSPAMVMAKRTDASPMPSR